VIVRVVVDIEFGGSNDVMQHCHSRELLFMVNASLHVGLSTGVIISLILAGEKWPWPEISLGLKEC